MASFVWPPSLSGGSGVTSLDGLTGDITLIAGTGISITPSGSNITIAATGGSGSVTSVGLSVPGSSIFGVSGSPVTTSGTLGLTVTGTSGGIPYFDTTSTLSSSAALTNHALILGGGAGAAPAVLGSLGTTTTVLHGNASGAPSFGAVDLAADVTGNLPVTNLNSGTSASSTTFWRGDATWAAAGTVSSVGLSVPGSSIFGVSGSPVTSSGTLGLTVTGTSGGIPYFDTTSTLSTSAALTNHALVLGGGAGASPTVLGSLGTTTTVLHGNASGDPSFGAVSLSADVTGNLPVTNLNSGTSASSATFWRGDGAWATPAGTGITSLTSDVTGSGSGAVATTVAKIQGTTVSGTTGTTNVVFSGSPSIVTPVISGGSAANLVTFGIEDSSAAFQVLINPNSSTALTGDRTLFLDMVNANRTIKLAGNLTLGAALTTTPANAITFTSQGSTNVTLPTAGTLMPGTNWAAYTPTIVGCGTVTSNTGFWRRNGDSVHVRGSYVCGITTAANVTISLPTGANTIDTTKLSATQVALLGTLYRGAGGGALPGTGVGGWPISYVSGDLTTVYPAQTISSAVGFIQTLGTALANTTDFISYEFSVPVTQFAF